MSCPLNPMPQSLPAAVHTPRRLRAMQEARQRPMNPRAWSWRGSTTPDTTTTATVPAGTRAAQAGLPVRLASSTSAEESQ
ncbi:MAG: hypothetical protein GEEBNDBF_01773 [bacterium]|nr:hypothetical protein [bacterium]